MGWTADQIVQLATSYWQSVALSAAVELKLFDAIGHGSCTAEQIASQLGTSPRYTEVLLDALSAVGLLAKHERRYCIEPSAARFLDRSSSECMMDALRYNLDLNLMWNHLADCVRTGRPAHPPTGHLGDDPARTERFVRAMHSRAKALAPALLPAICLNGSASLLDVAAGPGTFSCLLAERNPRLRVTLFDLPPILDVAKSLVAETAPADRVDYHPGNYTHDPLPAGYDTVLFSGALHQETGAGAAAVLKKIFHALSAGGEVVLVDMLLHEDRTRPMFSSLFAVNMLLTSASSHVYTEQEVCRLLGDVGFVETACVEVADCPYWVIKARKPPV